MGEKEQRNVNTALKMAAMKTLDPQQVGKGMIWYLLVLEFGATYLVGRAFGAYTSADDFGRAFFADHSTLYLVERISQAALSMAALWFLYRLGRKLAGDRGGLWALAFGSLSAIHINVSRYGSEELLMILFATLALHRALAHADSGSSSDLNWSVGWAAACAACKIVGGIALLAVLPALCARREWRRLILSFVLFAAVYFILNPYLLQAPKVSLASFVRDIQLRQESGTAGGYGFTLRALCGQMLGYPLALFAAAGLAAPGPWRRRLWLCVIPSILVYILYLGRGWQMGPDYLLPIWPMLILCAVAGLEFAYRKFAAGIVHAAGLVCLLTPLFFLDGYTPVLAQIRENLRPVPAHEMILWIRKNVPRGESIAVMSGGTWKGRLFLRADRIRERLDRFKNVPTYLELDYNLGNLQLYEFMLNVVTSDETVPCYDLQFLSALTRAELDREVRSRTMNWIEGTRSYEQWMPLAALGARYFLFVGDMQNIPPPRYAEIEEQLNRHAKVAVSFPPFYLYDMALP